MNFSDIVLIALFIEAVVNALKPIWTKGEAKITVAEYVSMSIGILIAATCRINMLATLISPIYPVWVEYIFYVLTGIAIGRGTNFLYDLWEKLKSWNITEKEETVLEGEEFDYSISHWPTEMIVSFALANGLPLPDRTNGSIPTKHELLDTMFRQNVTSVVEETKPPEADGVG